MDSCTWRGQIYRHIRKNTLVRAPGEAKSLGRPDPSSSTKQPIRSRHPRQLCGASASLETSPSREGVARTL
eukprot:5462868-Pyramimonas_sp.AAC.1